MTLPIYALTLAIFAQGCSEFMFAGLITEVGDDFGVSLAAAGTLTSAFAVGIIVGAPLMALIGGRWPRRRALVLFLSVFIAAHIVGATAASFPLLLIVRVVSAVANAGFLAVALTTAMSIAGPRAKGRTTALLLSGITIACVAGVPGGAALGYFWGWRAALWAVVLVSVPALAAIMYALPAGRPVTGLPSAIGELRTLRNRRLQTTLAAGVLCNAATFCAFTYLAPVSVQVTSLSPAWTPALLALFGCGSFVGVHATGRLADSHANLVAGGGGVLLLAGWIAFAGTAAHDWLFVTLVFALGALSFGVGSTLFSQGLYAASDAPMLGSSLTTAAFNVGTVIGPSLGGASIHTPLGYRGPLWVSVMLAALALVVTLCGLQARRRTRRAVTSARSS